MTDKPPIVTGLGDEDLLAAHRTASSSQTHIIGSLRTLNAIRAHLGASAYVMCESCNADPCQCNPRKPCQALLCPSGCPVEIIFREGGIGNHCPSCMRSFSAEHIARSAYARGRSSVDLPVPALHVWWFESTADWFAAATVEDALNEWREYHHGSTEPAEDDPVPALLPDDHELEIGDCNGDDAESKTCAVWAKERGPGWIAREI